jgi:dihydrofolate reductase
VVTRNRDYVAPGATVVYSIEEALDVAAARKPAEIIIGGGAVLYEALLPQAGRLYLTLIDAEVEGDAFFPPLDWSEWQETYRQPHKADEQHAYSFIWLILDRER